MLLNYKNLNDETKERYYLLHKLGLINYDLISCVKIIYINKDINDPLLTLYCSKMLYVHSNEAIKYLRENLDLYEKYIDKSILDSDFYLSLKKEMDYNNKASYSNRFIKEYRSNSIHYKDEYKYQYLNEFYNNAKELSSYFPEIEKDFPGDFNFEMKSMMINQNMFISEKKISIAQYSNIILDNFVEKLILIIENTIKNLFNELEG